MNSSIFITLLSLAIVGALAYFAAVGFRGSGKNEEIPANLTKYKSDDELETKHLDKSLSWAVLIASLLTIMIPLYYLGEDSRQESFVEEFEDVSVERGHHLYEEFGCGNCHGVDGGGGAASYVEKRNIIDLEKKYWGHALVSAALRFYLSRLLDLHFPKIGEMTHIKDPLIFENILKDRINTSYILRI